MNQFASQLSIHILATCLLQWIISAQAEQNVSCLYPLHSGDKCVLLCFSIAISQCFSVIKYFFLKIWKNNKIMVFVKEYLIFIHLNMWPDHVKDLCFGLLRFDLAVYEINMQLGNKSAFHLAWGSERKQRWTGGSVIMIQPMCFRTLKKRTFSRRPWLWHGNQRGSLFNNEQVETQCNGYMHLLCAPVNYLIRTLP